MTAIPFPVARDTLGELIDKVASGHEPVIINHEGKRAVLVAVEDFEERDDTAHLMSSPANVRRLNEAMAQLNAGKGIERELDLEA